ncbi:hypothetical protein HanRHA438_Chr13g0581681 [Helianthus annuus]|uniref:Uncharacterized protein n=1 Tax=Helianthus annuus TaxID=4232 RepID=A0A9K3EF76_HELAN|nr:hypothetical protein HanXRQr2_Chr13g0570441 [Helianthus annuus]KAJ0475626.1 hypothetical protein HanHA300_Chr13g0467661 [Helianthus annuus]KAJ0496406.1 hypothetical protein HanHA89_Chr13g0499371 [Helianthus annuus]KAJ0662467.1 hypothetical protein HanLR1_Chr13g0469821 [Helianthus annuus]KAJ0669991.1 hypothetical protein HanOQP8_Chr13g0468901 [Helianthus annuus]
MSKSKLKNVTRLINRISSACINLHSYNVITVDWSKSWMRH